MKIQKPLRETHSVEALFREFQSELGRALAAHPGQNFAIDLFDVLRTALYIMISVPAYLIASLLFAAATYVRIAGVLLTAE